VAKNFIKNRKAQSDYWNTSVVVMMIFIVSGFAILLASMPQELRYIGPLYNKAEVPEQFSMSRSLVGKYLYAINNKTIYHQTSSMDKVATWFDFNTESVTKFNLKLYVQWAYSSDLISIGRLKAWFIFNIFSWMQNDTIGAWIGKNNLLQYYDPSHNFTLIENVKDDQISVDVAFTDTNISRNDLSQAWDEGLLKCSIGFGWQNQTLVYNMWDCMARLLLFQAYEFGVDPVTNFLIILPIWTAIIYIVARITLLIIQSLPSYGGGGGGG